MNVGYVFDWETIALFMLQLQEIINEYNWRSTYFWITCNINTMIENNQCKQRIVTIEKLIICTVCKQNKTDTLKDIYYNVHHWIYSYKPITINAIQVLESIATCLCVKKV